MSWEILTPLGAFLAMALGVWAALSALAERRSRLDDRLERMVRGTARRGGASSLMKRQDRLQALVARAAPALSKPLRPTNEAELGRLRLALLNAGFRGEQAVQVYLGVKLLALLAGLALAGPAAYARWGLSQKGLGAAVLAGALGFYLPGVALAMIRKSRKEAIFLGLPDALDLMVVCVEAGLGLDAAMRRVTAELAEASPVLCEELAIANFQLQVGRARRDVLHDLGMRTGVDDMRALAAVLIQAERFGSSIATALRVQSDSMRVRRRQLAEERAAKTAVQLLVPLILFIFPGIFVVLVGPAGLQIARTLMKP